MLKPYNNKTSEEQNLQAGSSLRLKLALNRTLQG